MIGHPNRQMEKTEYRRRYDSLVEIDGVNRLGVGGGGRGW